MGALESAGWQIVVLAAVGAPLLAAVVVALTATYGARARFEVAAAAAALPALFAAVILPPGQVELGGLFLGASIAVDPLGRLFFALTAIVWLVGGVYGLGYLRKRHHRPEFFAVYGVALCGALGLTLAADIVSFYVLFNVMTLASYGLIVHERDARATRAARIYIAMAIGGDVLLFAGIVLVAFESGGLDLAAAPAAIAESNATGLISALLFFGFGVKAGALGLHMWLPLAHPAAPTPASAILSGAVIKAGLLGWLRFLPLGETSVAALGLWVAASGLFAAFAAALYGAFAREAKTVLAYSSVSQMGLVTSVVGVVLLRPDRVDQGMLAAGGFAVHHGLSKLALFLGVGVVRARLHPLARGLAFGGVVFGVAAMVGLPLTSGAVAKKAMAEVAPGGVGPGFELLSSLIALSSAATLIVLIALLARLRREAGIERAAPPIMLFAYGASVVLLAASVAVFPAIGLGEVLRESVALAEVAGALWPLAVGGVVVAAAAAIARYGGRLPTAAPGDLIVVLASVGRDARAMSRGLGGRLEETRAALRSRTRRTWLRIRPLLARALATESWLVTFRVGALATVLIALALALASMGW